LEIINKVSTNCAPLLADLFLNSYEAEFVQKLLRDNNQKKPKKLAVSFNHTFRYIDDVLSINNYNFHIYVHSASYRDILLNIDSNGRLTTSLYEKRDDFDFAIVLFYVVTYHFHLFMMCISPSWFDTQEHGLRMRTFQNEANYLQKVDVAWL
jgi:hypothetical protein